MTAWYCVNAACLQVSTAGAGGDHHVLQKHPKSSQLPCQVCDRSEHDSNGRIEEMYCARLRMHPALSSTADP